MGALTTAQQQPIAMTNYRDQIGTIKQTVAKGATDAQLEMFLSLAQRYQLDPFLRELWFTPQLGIITGRDGYLKIAQRDPDYDGISSMAVRENDEFEFDPVTPKVHHKFAKGDRGKIIGAYAIVYHKQRRPVVAFADISEYQKNTPVWNTYKSALICKVAEVFALKRQFGISGLVTEEEIGHAEPEPKQAPKASTTVGKTVDLSKMHAELNAAKDVIGAEAFFRILGAEGFEKVEEIKTRPDGERIYGLFKHEMAAQAAQVQDAEVVNG